MVGVPQNIATAGRQRRWPPTSLNSSLSDLTAWDTAASIELPGCEKASGRTITPAPAAAAVVAMRSSSVET